MSVDSPERESLSSFGLQLLLWTHKGVVWPVYAALGYCAVYKLVWMDSTVLIIKLVALIAAGGFDAVRLASASAGNLGESVG